MVYYKLDGIGVGTKCTMGNEKFKMSTDLPINRGGTNTAPQPVELMLASLCGIAT